jgi:hypothetical protein
MLSNADNMPVLGNSLAWSVVDQLGKSLPPNWSVRLRTDGVVAREVLLGEHRG